MSFLAATTFVEGAIDVLVVVAALELLDIGAGGVGWLNAAWGVGGLVGGAVALGVLRRGRLSLGLAVGCAIAGTALALIAVEPTAGRGAGDAGRCSASATRGSRSRG